MPNVRISINHCFINLFNTDSLSLEVEQDWLSSEP